VGDEAAHLSVDASRQATSLCRSPASDTEFSLLLEPSPATGTTLSVGSRALTVPLPCNRVHWLALSRRMGHTLALILVSR
jgi:hypothetical protein